MTIEATIAADPPPDTSEPIEVFTAIAAKHGLIKPGDKLDDNVIAAMADLVCRCAAVAEEYETDDGNAGEHIRSALYPF